MDLGPLSEKRKRNLWPLQPQGGGLSQQKVIVSSASDSLVWPKKKRTKRVEIKLSETIETNLSVEENNKLLRLKKKKLFLIQTLKLL